MAKKQGSKYELRAKEELEAAGYLVDRARGQIVWIPTPRWHPSFGKVPRIPITKDVDWLDAFDLEAVSPRDIVYVQVTGGGYSAASRRRAKVVAVAGNFPDAEIIKLQVWRWILRKGWWKEQLDRKTGEWVTLCKPGEPAKLSNTQV